MRLLSVPLLSLLELDEKVLRIFEPFLLSKLRLIWRFQLVVHLWKPRPWMLSLLAADDIRFELRVKETWTRFDMHVLFAVCRVLRITSTSDRSHIRLREFKSAAQLILLTQCPGANPLGHGRSGGHRLLHVATPGRPRRRAGPAERTCFGNESR